MMKRGENWAQQRNEHKLMEPKGQPRKTFLDFLGLLGQCLLKRSSFYLPLFISLSSEDREQAALSPAAMITPVALSSDFLMVLGPDKLPELYSNRRQSIWTQKKPSMILIRELLCQNMPHSHYTYKARWADWLPTPFSLVNNVWRGLIPFFLNMLNSQPD